MTPKRVRWGILGLRVVGVIALLILALAGWTAIGNHSLPRHSAVVDRLSQGEKSLLAEALHLHRTVGDSIWPGWARAELPVVVYNERYAFLVGLPDPAAGWIKVPGNRVRGGPWERAPGDSFEGAPYCRQLLPSPGVNPEAFTVRIGDRWAASLPTLDWLCIDLADHMRSGMPRVLAAVFPYRLAVRLFTGGSEGYVCMLQHEGFHAFQGAIAPEKLAAAERATALEGKYPTGQAALEEAWQRELGALSDCLRSASRAETRTQAQRFLASRRERRARFGLSDSLAGYERKREWLEGLAKYVELESWRRAAQTPGYRPVAAALGGADVKGYTGYARRWAQETGQVRWSRGDVRFYYSGMAQAVTLDRLMPGWKVRALDDSTWLEDLLAEAVRMPVP